MPKRPPSPRTSRREAERAAASLAERREAVARSEPGGSPERPLELPSASVVEPRATSLSCWQCGESSQRIDEHSSTAFADRRLRVVRLRCGRCGARRVLYVAITPPLPN